jgi:soluble lytic murein transglycosylase-like protein
MVTGDRWRRIYRRCRLVGWAVVAGLAVLLAPAQLAGDGFKITAAMEYQVVKVRSVLGQQPLGLSEGKLDQLARSIVEESERHSLDAMLLLAIIHVESRFDPRAVSQKGAQGLMQVRSVAVAALVEDERISRLPPKVDLKDPLINVRVGASYLALLQEMFGELKLSLEAYNQGPTRVRSRIAAREELSFAYADQVLSVKRGLERETASRDPA